MPDAVNVGGRRNERGSVCWFTGRSCHRMAVCSVVDRSGRFRGHGADRCVLGAFERDRGSPGTVRSYAFDLRDFFAFLDAHQIDWVTVRLEHLGRFVALLRLPPDTPYRNGGRATDSAPALLRFTINRKLSAVASFY